MRLYPPGLNLPNPTDFFMRTQPVTTGLTYSRVGGVGASQDPRPLNPGTPMAVGGGTPAVVPASSGDDTATLADIANYRMTPEDYALWLALHNLDAATYQSSLGGPAAWGGNAFTLGLADYRNNYNAAHAGLPPSTAMASPSGGPAAAPAPTQSGGLAPMAAGSNFGLVIVAAAAAWFFLLRKK
jgi:hypothetical protein